MPTSYDTVLLEEFQDEEYRYAYAEDFLNAWVATQIVTIREQRGLTQTEFGNLIGTKQPGVSRLENVNHSTWSTETLKRIARALGVRLKISFETFGTLLDEDAVFSRESLQRPTFDQDPVFSGSTQEAVFPLTRPVVLHGGELSSDVTVGLNLARDASAYAYYYHVRSQAQAIDAGYIIPSGTNMQPLARIGSRELVAP